MEDVAEDTVVDVVFIVVIWFDDVTHVAIKELQLAAHIQVDGRRSQEVTLKSFPKELHHSIRFYDGLWGSLYRRLTGLK